MSYDWGVEIVALISCFFQERSCFESTLGQPRLHVIWSYEQSVLGNLRTIISWYCLSASDTFRGVLEFFYVFIKKKAISIQISLSLLSAFDFCLLRYHSEAFSPSLMFPLSPFLHACKRLSFSICFLTYNPFLSHLSVCAIRWIEIKEDF